MRPIPIIGGFFGGDQCSVTKRVVSFSCNPWQAPKGGSDCRKCKDGEKNGIEIADTILDLLDKPKSLKTFVEDRKGHDMRYAIDHSKITKELGWEPSVTFEEGIKKTIEWYNNKN